MMQVVELSPYKTLTRKELDGVDIHLERDEPDVVDPTTKFAALNATNSMLAHSSKPVGETRISLKDWMFMFQERLFLERDCCVVIAVLHVVVRRAKL